MSESSAVLAAFREEVRDWIARNAPEVIKGPLRTMNDCPWGGRRAVFANEDQRLWFERMRDKGWICPDWSPDHGGAGLEAEQARVLAEELATGHCPAEQREAKVLEMAERLSRGPDAGLNDAHRR